MAKRLQHSELDQETPLQVIERLPPGFLEVSDDTPIEQWPTNLQVGSPRWKAYLVNAATTPDLFLTPGEEVTLEAVHWIVVRTEREDEKTGEVRRFTQLVLFDRDGNTFATSGEFARHDLARVLRAYDPAEWAAGITFRVKSRPNRAGTRSYHQLRVIPKEG